MIEKMLSVFVKNYQDINDDTVRKNYGFFSSIVGILCNILLFGIKYILGTLSGSVSIISDAFNNLSDSGSCIITLIGYKMASKPADKEHPFGHRRLEYVFSLVVAAIVMIVGFELLKNSIDKLLHPEKLQFEWIFVVALVASILIKLWMSHFNKVLGNKIDSKVMLATAQDSANDVFATVATMIALLSSLFTNLPVDGAIGCVVSIVVLFAGYGIIKDTVEELIGKPADPEVVAALKEIFDQSEIALGYHDFMIHSYGPGVIFGSAHIEVDSRGDIIAIHEAIDDLEKEVYEKLKIVLTIHMDPIEMENEVLNEAKRIAVDALKKIDGNLTLHDFRMVNGTGHINFIFDIVLPFDCPKTEKEIRAEMGEALKGINPAYNAVIEFDRKYA